MDVPFRLILLAALGWLEFVLFSDVKAQGRLDEPDKGRVILLFGGAVLDGVAIAVMLALMVVPAIGESIGSFFYGQGQDFEPDPHSRAIARLAQGDPEGAIEAYEEVLKDDPSDALALSEIARICCRNLEDTARAAAVIDLALEREWPHEQGAFLANRLADIYLLQDDAVRARQVLIGLARTLEGTKYAAHAVHRLHELDRSANPGKSAPQLPDATAPPPRDPFSPFENGKSPFDP